MAFAPRDCLFNGYVLWITAASTVFTSSYAALRHAAVEFMSSAVYVFPGSQVSSAGTKVSVIMQSWLPLPAKPAAFQVSSTCQWDVDRAAIRHSGVSLTEL